jgi:hypothetical protein
MTMIAVSIAVFLQNTNIGLILIFEIIILKVPDNFVRSVMIKHMEEIVMTPTIILKNTNKRVRKLDSSIIRVGDEIKIIIPEAFDRVGYPLTRKKIIGEMTPEQLQALNDCLIKTFDIGIDIETNLCTVLNNEPVHDKIIDTIASRILRKREWGGDDRKIYAKPIPDFCIGQVSNVLSKKVVKTGKYIPGWNRYDYWGEYDSSPAYLENEKTHVLYQMMVLTDCNPDGCIKWYKEMYFEKRCIQKVTYNHYTGEYE